jgi:hypothetical protein
MAFLDDDIVEFLCDPSNLHIAFDIWERFPMARDKLIISFWKEFLEISTAKITEYSGWRIESGDDQRKTDQDWLYKTKTIKIYQELPAGTDDGKVLHFAIEHQGADKQYTAFYGLPWYVSNRGQLPSEALVLINELIRGDFKKDQWYAAYRNLSPELVSKEALILISERRYAQTIAEEFWGFFSTYQAKVADINTILTSKDQI